MVWLTSRMGVMEPEDPDLHSRMEDMVQKVKAATNKDMRKYLNGLESYVHHNTYRVMLKSPYEPVKPAELVESNTEYRPNTE